MITQNISLECQFEISLTMSIHLGGHDYSKYNSSATTFVRIIIHLEANVAECIQHHNRGGLKQFRAMLVFMIAMVMRLMLPLMTMTMIVEVSGYLNPDAMVGIVVAFSSQTHLKLALHFHYHQDDDHVHR